MVMLMGGKCSKVHVVQFVILVFKGVKDIQLQDIFGTFFLLKKIIHFIRGPPLYQFKNFKLIGGYKWINI